MGCVHTHIILKLILYVYCWLIPYIRLKSGKRKTLHLGFLDENTKGGAWSDWTTDGIGPCASL